jgi:hypothetical protein
MCGVGDFGIDMGKEAGDVKEDFGERVDANWSKKKGYKKRELIERHDVFDTQA